MNRRVIIVATMLSFLFGVSTIETNAYAASECGVVVAGGTATCAGDGTPAGDANPYTSGITYTVPMTLIVDGTLTPLIIRGPVLSATNAAGLLDIKMFGNIEITRNGVLTENATVGRYVNTSLTSKVVTLGPNVTINDTNTRSSATTTALQHYTVGAGGSNTSLIINSQATVNTIYNGTGMNIFTGSIIVRDFGVLNSPSSIVDVTSSGNINVDINNVSMGTVYGIYAGAAASPNKVTVTSSSPITVSGNNPVGSDSYSFGVWARNQNGAGGVSVTQDGAINMYGTWRESVGV